MSPSSLEFYQKPSLLAEFYQHKAPPPGGYPPRDTPEALLNADNKAHDNIVKLVKVNDILRRDLGKALKALNVEQRWRQGIFYGLLVSVFVMLLDIVLR